MTTITVAGNLTADPELKFTTAGAAYASFTIADTPRAFDKKTESWVDGETIFWRCTCWRDQAEQVAENLRKGQRVIATGSLKAHTWEKDGQKHTALDLTVDDCGASLKFPPRNGAGAPRAAQAAAAPASTSSPF